MATTERIGLLTSVDDGGNHTLIYPVTTAEAVDGLDEAITEKISESGNSSSSSKNVTLPVSGWANNKQTLAVSGVTTNSTIFVSGDSGSEPEYSTCEVYCSAQANGSLTFSCTYLPMEDVVANVCIIT